MPKFWKLRIKMKKMTLEEVPERWREETRKLLEEDDKEKTEENP